MTGSLPKPPSGATGDPDGGVEAPDSAGCSRLLLLAAGLFLLALAAKSPAIHWAGRESTARVTKVLTEPAGPISGTRVHYVFGTGGGAEQESVRVWPADGSPEPAVGDEFSVMYLGPVPALHERADDGPGVSSLVLGIISLLFLALALRPGGSRPPVVE